MTDEFEKDHIKKFGARGAPVFEQTKSKTDLDDLTERVEETCQPFCTCGAPLTATPEAYRCCNCELICCPRCQIRHSKQTFCPTCARRRFALDKRTFFSLIFLQHDVIGADDLVTVETIGNEPVEITVDTAATVLAEHDYLAEDGTLSPAGKEALSIGKQLYGEDDDVQSVMNQLRIQEVVNE